MGNFFISCDLIQGEEEIRARMDEHIARLGPCAFRVLENVWHVRSAGTLQALYGYVNKVLPMDDRIIVIEAEDCMFRGLLVSKEHMKNCWKVSSL